MAPARAVRGDQARPELHAFFPVHREPGVLRRAGPDVPGARGEEGHRCRRDRLRAHDVQALEDRALCGIRKGPDHQVLQEDRDLRCRESGRRRAGRGRSHPHHHLPRGRLAQARAEHGRRPEGVRLLRAPQRVGQGAAAGSREARRRPGAAQVPAAPVRSEARGLEGRVVGAVASGRGRSHHQRLSGLDARLVPLHHGDQELGGDHAPGRSGLDAPAELPEEQPALPARPGLGPPGPERASVPRTAGGAAPRTRGQGEAVRRRRDAGHSSPGGPTGRTGRSARQTWFWPPPTSSPPTWPASPSCATAR